MKKNIKLQGLQKAIGEANSCLKNFRQQIKVFSDWKKNAQLVRAKNDKGQKVEGFFNRFEIILGDKLTYCLVVNPVLQLDNGIMASSHEDYLSEPLVIESFQHKKYKYRVL